MSFCCVNVLLLSFHGRLHLCVRHLSGYQSVAGHERNDSSEADWLHHVHQLMDKASNTPRMSKHIFMFVEHLVTVGGSEATTIIRECSVLETSLSQAVYG